MSLAPEVVQTPVKQYATSRALALWFDNDLFDRARLIATYISKAEGFTPRHLLGKGEACFMVVEKALNWNLSPSFVAACTYQTPNGNVGYEGKLIHAILEASGRLEGAVTYEHFCDVMLEKAAVTMPDGTVISPAARQRISTTDQDYAGLKADGWKIVQRFGWDRVQGKFRKEKSQKTDKFGKPKDSYYAVPNWSTEDEAGLGVIVRAKVKGEVDPREWPLLLVQAFPRNSTMWATDPKSQICYLAARRFANLAMPHILMGVPFDREDEVEMMVDITPPRPDRAEFTPAETGPKVTEVETQQDEETELSPADEAATDIAARQFAETGKLETEEREPEPEPETAQEYTSDARPDRTAEERPNATFWAADNYTVTVPVTQKGAPHFPEWCSHMRQALVDARTRSELVKLDTDNAKSFQVLQLKMPDAYKSLRQAFTARAEELLS